MEEGRRGEERGKGVKGEGVRTCFDDTLDIVNDGLGELGFSVLDCHGDAFPGDVLDCRV